ncbi:MAG: class I SAM-dependent methyltransferase, partial [Chlorobiaceae bacterium]|nr:class I SAM-dependent methyltransferase [Chlorobiaceae bacterium]
MINNSLFLHPARIVEPASWSRHIPFSFWIVEASKPEVIVELGTHSGNSYFSFCQSVRHNCLSTHCYAIHSSFDDEESELYDNDIFNAVLTYNKEHYQDFSAVIQNTFDKALSFFEDASIDILHINSESLNNSFIKLFLPSARSPEFITFNNLSANAIFFNVSITTLPNAAGAIYWDNTDKTLAINSGLGPILQVGQEQWLRVRNNTGVEIQDGKVVYITGRLGNRPTVALARADADPAAHAIGVTTQHIPHNTDGFVTINGSVRGIDLSAYTSGAHVYLSATNAGEFTQTAPSLPNYVVRVGYVAVNLNNGQLDVDMGLEPTGRSNFNELGVIGKLQSLNGAKFNSISTNNIYIGATSPSASTGTPAVVKMDSSYSDTAGSNPKIYVWADAANYMGFGASLGQLDYITDPFSPQDHVWYTQGTEKMRLSAGGNLIVLGNISTATLKANNIPYVTSSIASHNTLS